MSGDGVKSFSYAIADLHGRLDLVVSALGLIAIHAADNKVDHATLVIAGDAIDRGPSSGALVAWLMETTAIVSDKIRIIYLKGNHDDMMVQCIRGKKRLDWWLGNGGYATLESYGAIAPRDVTVVPKGHIEFLDNSPLYYADKHRVFVHASVDPAMPLDGQNKQVLLWEYQGRYNTGGYRDKFVVHGHEAFEDGPVRTNSRINLDTKAWRTGRLVIAVFDDEIPGGPIEILEVRGRPYSMQTGDYE